MLWVVPLLLSSFLAYGQDAQRAADAFTQGHVVPDVLPSFSPLASIDVVFTDPTNMQQLNVTPGMNLTMTRKFSFVFEDTQVPDTTPVPPETSMQPQFFLNTTNTTLANGTFVLAIVDPDAPTPQNTSISQFRHMLGGDFRVNATGGVLMNTSAALSDFVPPTPPAGSDPHRYVILLFNQSASFDTNAPALVNASTPRTNFNISMFASALQLGTPVAGTFFLTGPDNSSTASGAAPSSTAPAAPGANGAVRYQPITSSFHSPMALARPTTKLPPGANRILFVKNLNYQITGEDLYDLFGRYGSIRQIRIGNEQKTKGTAFVVFDDVMDAKNALDHLNGFHLQERYIVVLYHMPAKQDAAAAKADLARREEELAQLKSKHDIGDD
ncbi:hypothetical protein EYR36_006463 [Pleurotus pulmonarius]|nr:hypothetical protein EYR36_006463 [Pleurotus pulmonarius]KAF4601163.1 hypothetical protein EYR38_005813 [Pleurotus pulmonarius]